METKDLKPNGTNIPVTESNKREYVQLACQMKMTGSIRSQIKSFLEGFYDVIPKELISIFNEQELELLISGLPTIDIDDLKSYTEYHKYMEHSLQVCYEVNVSVNVVDGALAICIVKWLSISKYMCCGWAGMCYEFVY